MDPNKPTNTVQQEPAYERDEGPLLDEYVERPDEEVQDSIFEGKPISGKTLFTGQGEVEPIADRLEMLSRTLSENHHAFGESIENSLGDGLSPSKTEHITPIGGNVFLDLGFPPDEAVQLKAQSDAMIAEKRDTKLIGR